MREVIENVRKMLSDGLFSDEQHVRYSLVGRICKELGWNIWNPAEFYTEYPVKKYPPQEVTTELRGRVDVALFLADKRTDKAEVFIEVKSPGRLQYELQSGEIQLQRYNYWDKAAICILTDGITWRFYLPSEGGSFDSTLFNEFHILNDSVEIICQTLDKVLRRDNFRKQAVQTASGMYEELGKTRLIHKVKNKAIQIASETGMDVYLIAQQLLKQTEHIEMELTEIKRLWDKTIPESVTPRPTPSPTFTPIPKPTPLPPGDYVKTFISARGVKASGCYNIKTKQFTLYKDSEVVLHHSSSFMGNYLVKKKKMIESGLLQLDPSGTKYLLTKDTVFNAPSPAAHLVLGRASSGYVDWVDDKGRKLDEYRQ